MEKKRKEAIKMEIYGESHAEHIGVRISGIEAGQPIDIDELQSFLGRRAPGNAGWSTSRRELDHPVFVRGITNGVTDGNTIEAVIYNTDVKKEAYEKIRFVPRPGHADYCAYIKDGKIPSGGGRWSGRMTAPLCIAGGILKQFLQREGIKIQAHISRILDVFDDELTEDSHLLTDFPVTSKTASKEMQALISETKENGDSIGGEISCMISGVPAGLGDALFDGVEARLSQELFAIPALKGVEFGSLKHYGSVNNDPFVIKDGRVVTETNNCGGILGGITTGMPIEFTAKFKPTPSIALAQKSVNLETLEEVSLKIEGRHDPCILPRAVPCVEAAAAIGIYKLLKGE